ncbi:Hypothetical predicted protein [Paramuricea clavata]|uniref:Uncharacterized protein n=1 Tax=Paramuricea clavata TaxID=317549 RepID=A0A6S7GGC7_PARCT|nr:Hypothetical predicted protein [Paramuricea clavata]
MKLNAKKTKDMWICFKAAIPEPPHLKIGDDTIERVKSFKLLEQRRDKLSIREYEKVINDETHPCRKYIPDMVTNKWINKTITTRAKSGKERALIAPVQAEVQQKKGNFIPSEKQYSHGVEDEVIQPRSSQPKKNRKQSVMVKKIQSMVKVRGMKKKISS